MKRFNLTVLMALCLGGRAWAGPQPTLFLNVGTVTNRSNIDASVFVNNGLILFDLVASDVVDGAVFQTRDTLNFTNTGIMIGQPGFNFDTVTATGIHAASSFNNSGTILAVDAPVVGFFALEGATIPILVAPQAGGPGTNTPVASLLTVSAANINIGGTMSVGDLGVLQLNGANIKLDNAYLIAGTVSEVDTNATVGEGIDAGYILGGVLTPFFAPPADVYDIYWAVTNGASFNGNVEEYPDLLGLSTAIQPLDVADLVLEEGPTNTLTRNGTLDGLPVGTPTRSYAIPAGEFFPISTFVQFGPSAPVVTSPPVTANFVGYADLTTVLQTDAALTNFYYDVVLVNSAFADPDITAQVEFIEEGGGGLTLTNGDEFQTECLVKFSAPVADVITGQTVTNSIYLLDTSGIQTPNFLSGNSIYPSDFEPLGFQISRIQPVEWTEGLPGNTPYDPTLSELYTAGVFQSITAPMTNSFYAAQIGRNPEQPDGLFDYTATLLGRSQNGVPQGFPDPTNEPGRIEINATATNDSSNLSLRANGVVKLNSPNFTGIPAGADFGNMNVDLGNLKSALTVSNMFPATFHRLRGDVAAFSASWVNLQTNNGLGTGGANKVTNTWHVHVLIVDQDLRDTFQTTGMNVALRGSNVTLNDPLRVVTSALFQAANLTVNSSVHLTGAANVFQTGNVPGLKNLLVGANGSIEADNSIVIGVTDSASPVVPTTVNTPILSVTNLGQISSGQVELQARNFVNGGNIISTNFGSIVINSLTNLLGGGRGLTNGLTADANVDLTSTSIQATNSTILAGQSGTGQLVLQATSELTDHLPNTAATNKYVTNLWQVTGGFSLPVKPVSGDLFGTQITSVAASPNQRIHHAWAGQDLGASVAGFFNNVVIGHLVLDRTTNGAGALFEFSAAGKKNAMYVDFLDLEDATAGGYHTMLEIDPNFTIYFANANIDPAKLHQVYSNLVWVPQFAGPNSTTNVTYLGGSNCLMNVVLATSSTIDTDGDGIVNLNDNALLNNPGAGPVPCPSLITSSELLPVTNGLPGQQFIVWTTGHGVVTPSLSSKGLKAGEMITLTAVPAPGWLFLDWSGAVVSSATSIAFTVPTNVFSFVTANFITNSFIGLAGVYNGLFSVPGGVTNNSSGAVTFTLTTAGIFSGKLTMGSTNYAFSSRFNLANTASFFATNGHNVLGLTLQAGLDVEPDKATGTVTNGTFSADLVAYHVPVWTTAQPAPQAGTYTMVLPGNANAAASPGGDSYGTVTVDKLGNLKAVGSLADGASFSQAVPVSKGGQWPLYFVPTGVAQPLIGWVTFDTNGTGGTATGFSGAVTWIKSAGPGTYYPGGFTNTSVLDGNLYSAALQTPAVFNLNNPTITLSGGNLANTVIDGVSRTAAQTYQSADKSVTLTISAATGGFTGQYVAPGTTKKVPLAGVVLQNDGTTRGFFLGTNQSGAVLLQGN